MIRCNVYTSFIVFLLFIHPLISGCAVTSSRDLYKEEVKLNSQQLFHDICSKCHKLPDIEAYPYSSDDWAKIVDFMLETKEAEQYITIEVAEKIKSYLRSHSISGYKPLLNEE